MITLQDFVMKAYDTIQAKNEAKVRELLIAHGWDGKDLVMAKEIASEYEICMTQDGHVFDIRSKPVEKKPVTRFYAVTTRDFGEFHIITICTDRDKADRIAAWYNKVSMRKEVADVEEYDSVEVPEETDLPFYVLFCEDGSISWTQRGFPEAALKGSVFDRWDGTVAVNVLAPDEESAEEKATKRFRKTLEEK